MTFLQSKSFQRALKKNAPLYLLFLPTIAFYLIFKYAPMGGVLIAFKAYNFRDGIWNSPWVGWEHFELLFQSTRTVLVIWNTFKLSMLSLIISFPFPILLAILLNEVRKMWFRRAVQTIVYLPHFFSWVIIGGMVATIFSMQSSLLNHVITRVYGEPIPFMYQPGSWTAIFIGSGIWKEMGFSAIIYLAALSTIDPALYEAASIDGAGKLRKIWSITLPGISSTVVLVFILSLGRVMEVGFDHVYNLQNNAVASVSEVISTYIYAVGIQGGQFSLTTAMGLFESVIGFILVLSANWGARKLGHGLF
ncbi:ABC transporter permease [Paenibacillus cymbidii]|uniref:ABC transporter permease n=1 Tax=Paenibacillus cymbidii TaxID=1639034 RepID=UPI001080F60A|nr:ABC transporter permease subunit [Paenibacillus cymbidii]